LQQCTVDERGAGHAQCRPFRSPRHPRYQPLAAALLCLDQRGTTRRPVAGAAAAVASVALRGAALRPTPTSTCLQGCRQPRSSARSPLRPCSLTKWLPMHRAPPTIRASAMGFPLLTQSLPPTFTCLEKRTSSTPSSWPPRLLSSKGNLPRTPTPDRGQWRLGPRQRPRLAERHNRLS